MCLDFYDIINYHYSTDIILLSISLLSMVQIFIMSLENSLLVELYCMYHSLYSNYRKIPCWYSSNSLMRPGNSLLVELVSGGHALYIYWYSCNYKLENSLLVDLQYNIMLLPS